MLYNIILLVIYFIHCKFVYINLLPLTFPTLLPSPFCCPLVCSLYLQKQPIFIGKTFLSFQGKEQLIYSDISKYWVTELNWGSLVAKKLSEILLHLPKKKKKALPWSQPPDLAWRLFLPPWTCVLVGCISVSSRGAFTLKVFATVKEFRSVQWLQGGEWIYPQRMGKYEILVNKTGSYFEKCSPEKMNKIMGIAFASWLNIQQYTTASSVQSFSRVRLFATSRTAARQASLSITNSHSLLKLMSIESVMPSNHLILCHHLLLPPSIFPSIRVFSNESVLHIR